MNECPVPEGLYTSLSALRKKVAWTFPKGARRTKLLEYLSRILENGELGALAEFEAFVSEQIDTLESEVEKPIEVGN
jgi:hypothetical protein